MRSTPGAILVAVTLVLVTGCTSPPTGPPPPVEDSAQPLRARAAHSATLLGDGRVLLAGGCADDGCGTAEVQPTSEIYVPGRGFTLGPAMRYPRDAHSATTLRDGRVLMVGGFSGEGRPPLAESELFDPTAGTFSPTGNLATPRGGHMAALLPDGRVLVAGGWIGPRTYTATSEIYDPATGTFTAGPPMPEVRFQSTVLTLRDGRILVVGGQDTPTHVLNTALVFVPKANRWERVGAMGTQRFKHAMGMLPDGRVLVLGGSTSEETQLLSSTEVFDPATNRFTPGSSMGSQRYKCVVADTSSGLVVVGGTQVEKYDARSATFQAVAGTKGVWRSAPTVTVLRDGSILVVGGYDKGIRVHDDAVLIPPGA